MDRVKSMFRNLDGFDSMVVVIIAVAVAEGGLATFSYPLMLWLGCVNDVFNTGFAPGFWQVFGLIQPFLWYGVAKMGASSDK